MTADEWKLVGIVLCVMGVALLPTTQILLSVWHKRQLSER